MTESEPTQAVSPGADPDAQHPSDPGVVSPSEAVAREFGEAPDQSVDQPADEPEPQEPPDV